MDKPKISREKVIDPFVQKKMSTSSPQRSLSSASGSRSSIQDIPLHEMPGVERQNLCALLDELNIYQDLALNHMGYSRNDLQELNRAIQLGRSPTDELLTMWSEQNHTVTELFILLYRMQQYTAMDTIRNLVDRKYHRYIMQDQPDLSNLLKKDSAAIGANRQPNKVSNGISNSIITSSSNNESTTEETTTDDFNNSSFDKFNFIKNTNNGAINNGNNVGMKYVNKLASTIPQIDYKELALATDSWNEKHILGKGGFGTVYKGMWKYTAVAIKRIEYHGSGENNKIQIQQSLNELRYLNSCRHDNILPLYGYSINGDKPCLVYQLMQGGSLEQRLNPKKTNVPLTWSQRLTISQGTARGLQYLHTFKEKPLIHGDIKPANILLDPCGMPRIGDFGLAREGPNALDPSMEVSRVYGTKPYLPVEFLGYKSLSTKVDTYSFGVVLLELVTGLRAYDKLRQHKFLTKHMLSVLKENIPIEQIMDKTLMPEPEGVKICKTLLSIGIMCIAENPEDRPEMVNVLCHLDN